MAGKVPASMRLSHFLATTLAVGFLASALSEPVGAQDFSFSAAREGAEVGHTAPSSRRELTLGVMEVVRKVHVKPGDRVKQGQLLLSEDDSEEQVRLKIAKLLADADVEVKAAEVTLLNKKNELARYEKMYNPTTGKGVASEWEYQKAVLERDLAQLDVEKARLGQQKTRLEAELQDARLKRMQLLSPIDGIIEKIETEEGEVVDPQRPAIIVVSNDPLWVEVKMPAEKSIRLALGQEADVYYPGEKQARKAKIIYFNPVVDAKSGTHLVRLEMANPENRFSGLRVDVVFPKATAAVKNDQ